MTRHPRGARSVGRTRHGTGWSEGRTPCPSIVFPCWSRPRGRCSPAVCIAIPTPDGTAAGRRRERRGAAGRRITGLRLAWIHQAGDVDLAAVAEAARDGGQRGGRWTERCRCRCSAEA